MKNLKERFIFTIAVFFVAFYSLAIAKAQDEQIPFTLELGKPVIQVLDANQTHVYQIAIASGQFLRVIVDQKDFSLAVTLFDSDGTKILERDNPNIKLGPEILSFVTEKAGRYRLEIRSSESGARGRYDVVIESLRVANQTDKTRVTAEKSFLEGENLSAQATKEGFLGAIQKYEEALALLQGVGERYSEAVVLYSIGKAFDKTGEKRKALDYYRKALSLFQTAGSWDEIFKDLNGLYLLMGGKQKAFDYLVEALPLVRAMRNERLEAILLVGVAKVCDDMQAEAKAVDYYAQALSLFRITGKRGAEAFTLTEIGDSDLSYDDKKKALNYLQQALMLAQGASDPALEVSLITGMGYLNLLLGETQKALEQFQQTLPLWRALKDKNGEAHAFRFIGDIYLLLGETALAQDYFEKSLALFRAVEDRRAEAYALNNLGSIRNHLGETAKALDYYQQSLKLFRAAGDKHGEASALGLIGNAHLQMGQLQNALEQFKQALTLWRALGFREGEAAELLDLGFIYYSLGDQQQALDHFNQALSLFRLLGIPHGEANALYGLARVTRARGNLEAARANIEAALNIAESLRVKIASSEFRASYFASYQHFYELYINLLMQLHEAQPAQGFDALALKTNERARARSLLETIAESRADIRQGVDPALLERERGLQNQLNAKERGRSRVRGTQQTEVIEKEIRALTIEYQELQAQIKIKSPRYAALTQPQTLSLKEIQQLMDQDTLLIEYSLGKELSYLWLVSQSSIKSFRLPKRAEIETAARRFYEALKDEAAADKVDKAAIDLSRIALEPIASELGDKRLLIVADGALQYIPFAALSVASSKDNNSGQRTTDNRQPLIINHEIVYLPSASLLTVLRSETAERKTPPKTLAVLADPVFTVDDPRVKRDKVETETKKTAQRAAKSSTISLLKRAIRDVGASDAGDASYIDVKLPRLPGARREAQTILALVPETERMQALDFNASRATATSQELGQYRIVHFATHGILDSEHPELSGIILSLVDEQGKPQDGFLRLHEIFNLKLPAELIVLSACQTGLGKEIKGEGLIGLTRGFMYAGAMRVTTSLWEVDDKATSELMKRFYQEMLGEKKLKPAAALREAQIAMWKTKRWNAPYYWSAFVIQGEW